MIQLRGVTFIKQQKCDFLLLLVNTNEEQCLQYCNTAMRSSLSSYVNSGKSWGGGGGG